MAPSGAFLLRLGGVCSYNCLVNPPKEQKRNSRDLSTLQRSDGKRLKENLFFRSGSLYSSRKSELKFWDKVHLKTIIDLRTPGEIAKKPDPELQGVANVLCPILTEETLGITHERGLKAYKEPPHMPFLYAQLVTLKHSLEELSKALRIIMDPNREGAILWHCTAGKDRCGILTAILLKILGYDEEVIFRDYTHSERVTKPKGRRYRWLIRYLLWRKKTAQAVYEAMLARPEYLRSAFNAIEKAFGSFEAFVRDGLGISEEEINAFAQVNLVPVNEPA